MGKKRLIIGITGATGAAYGIQLLAMLKTDRAWESHLVLSEAGALNAWQELELKRKDIERLADVAYHPKDIGAALASGSFLTEGMVIAPCSMKTLSAGLAGDADGPGLAAAPRGVQKARPPPVPSPPDAAPPSPPPTHCP